MLKQSKTNPRLVTQENVTVSPIPDLRHTDLPLQVVNTETPINSQALWIPQKQVPLFC